LPNLLKVRAGPEINGKVICPRCREAVERHRTAGSGIARFLRAALVGSAAAFAGFLIYYGVMKIANMEIGLISILVGYMVGAGVRNGSRHRGGWLYQLLAIVLTYSAVAASYSATALPLFFAEIQKKADAGPAVEKKGDPAPDPANPDAAPGPQPDPHVQAAPGPGKGDAPTGPKLIVALVMLLGLCYALPVIVGFQQPMGLLIVAFALWEAWKLNKRVPVVINGPFEAATRPTREGLPPGGIPSHA
jgi:hypothetical protein